MKIGISVVQFGDASKLMCISSLERANNLIPERISQIFSYRIKDNNEDNIGFSKGNNKIILEYLHDDDERTDDYCGIIDWIWLLNNDTTVPDETFIAINNILPTLDSKIGIVGFQIRSLDDPDLIHHAGTFQAIPNGIHKSGSVKLGQFTKRTVEKWVTFASVLIRREVFEDIGLLDSHMFNYYSDSDFCYRARYSGWKVIYEPTFVINHKIGSSQNPSPEQMKMIQQDSIAFQSKWISGKLFFDFDKQLLE